MKKIVKIFKKNIKVIVAFVIGGIVFGGVGVVIAGDILASNVKYTKNSQTTVDGALDTLYARSSQWIDSNNMGTPNYYAEDSKPTTTSSSTPYSSWKVYVGLYSDFQYGVCIKRNGIEHCFRHNNWVAETKHLQNVFSDVSCFINSDGVHPDGFICDASDFNCAVGASGEISCRYKSSNKGLLVSSDGSVLKYS